MKNNNLIGPILGLAIVTMAGSVLAANEEPASSMDATGSPSTVMNPAPMTSDVVKPSDAPARHMLPPQAVIGKDVTNDTGDTIGKVTQIVGEQVIVAVGGFLGLGAYDVALDWGQFTTSGDGDDIKLQTMMSKDQLKAMPEYKS